MVFNKKDQNECYFLKTIFSKLGASIFILDLVTLKYQLLNDKHKDILGYQDEKMYSNTLQFAKDYFHPEDKQIVKDRIKAFRENKINSWSGVYRVKHKEGYWVWVYSKFTVCRHNNEGIPDRLLGFAFDATKDFKTTQQMNVLYRERVKKLNNSNINKLTVREIKIICLIVSGKTYNEIAEILFIQPDTVNKHRKNILQKLDLHNIASLVSFAKESGLA